MQNEIYLQQVKLEKSDTVMNINNVNIKWVIIIICIFTCLDSTSFFFITFF